MGAGSWEQRQANQVLVGILHTDIVPMKWALNLRNLQIPGRILPVAGQPYDHARDTICWTALHGNWQWAFHLDSDVTPPPDAIHRLMSHNLPLVSGVYHRRSTPHGVPVMIRRNEGWVTRYPANSLIEVDFVGAGCLLMRRDLLEKLARNPLDARRGHIFFDWRVNMPNLPPGEAVSEDFAMNLHIKKMFGIPTVVDTGVQCGHIGLGEAVPGAMIPCHAA